jgi:hypothetical protein
MMPHVPPNKGLHLIFALFEDGVSPWRVSWPILMIIVMIALHLEAMEVRCWSFGLFSSLFDGGILPFREFSCWRLYTCGLTTTYLCTIDYVMWRILLLYPL